MAFRVSQGQGIVVHVLGGDAVFRFVDCLDLGVGQVDIGGQSVCGSRVSRVEGALRNCVRQIDPENVIFSEFCVSFNLRPVCDRRAVLDHLAVFYMVIVDTGRIGQHPVKGKRLKGRDVCVGSGFCRCGVILSAAVLPGGIFRS